MKKLRFSVWLLALMLFSFSAKAQNTITLGSGDSGSSDFPINSYWSNSYTQSIYSIDELLDAGAPADGGIISNIQYRVKKDNSYFTNSNEWTIYMAQTNKSTFDDNNDWIPLTDLTEVFDGTMPASFSAHDWINFEFSQEFEWDGASNIVIAVKENKPGYNSSGDVFYAYNGTTQRGIFFRSDLNNPNPANPPYASGRTDKLALVKLFIEDIGSCSRPRMPHISEVTFTSAKINWTAPNSIPANGYQVFLTTEDDEPAQDAAPIATLGSDIEEYLFTDLTPNTQYYIWLRSNCGNDEFSNFSRSPVYTGYCIPQSTHENNSNYNKDFTTTGANVNIVDNFVPETPNNGYVDHYETHNVEIVQGTPVDFSVQVMGENVNFAIWVDWNNDMEFDNVAEKIYSQSSYNTNPTFSGTLNIGGTTTPGDYRMRIRAVGGSGTQNPCNDVAWGEARDYKLTVVALEDCTVPPYMTTASNITHTSAILNWMAPLLGNNPPEYEVQWDTDMEFGNPSSATTSNLRADVSGLLSGENYFYRVRSVCDENTKSAWSATETFLSGGHTPINVTGFNQDVIAEGDTPASQSTTAKLDADNNVLVATGFYLGDDSRQRLPLNRVLHNGTHGTVTPEGVKYLLQNYTENNAINLPGGEGTLTLVEPQIYETLYLTGFAGNGAASLTIKVVYEDDSEQDFNKSLGDWWQGNQYVIKLNGRVNRNTNSYDPTIDNPRFYQITLDGIDQSKAVKEILIQNPGGSSSSKIANIFAVSGIVPALCPQPQNLAATEIGADNATVTWTGPNPDNGYMVYISQSAAAPTAETEAMASVETGNEYIINGLTYSTTYYVWVRANCGDNDLSIWAGPVSFTTDDVPTFMLTLNGTNGTLSGAGSYAEGETVNISAIPNAGYNFVHWLYAGQVFSDEAQHSFQMPNSNMILTAVFEDENAEKFTLTLQANPEEAATLTGEGEYSQGTTISVKAEVTNEDDYEFLYWLKGDAVISQTAEFNFVMPGEAVTLVARYKIITSIENNDLDEVNVYPNPSNGIFNIVVNKDYLMEVVDLTGRTITTQNIIQGMNTLNIQNVNSGIYFIRLTSNNDTKTIRIVKN